MARARKQQADSLELLLDTICNTFGGVVFIAILVVILLQSAGDRQPVEEKADTDVSAEELAELEHRLAKATSELNSLRETQASQDSLMALLAPKEVQSLVQSRNQSRENRRELEISREQLVADIAQRQTKIQKLKAELSTIHAQRQESQQRLEQLEERIERERESRREEVRLPVVHANMRGQSLGVILRYGRLYVWHRYDQRGNQSGLNTDDFVILGEDAVGYITTPKPNAGIPLRDGAETKRRIIQRLRKFPPRQTVIEIAVRPDSFTHFRHLRDVLLERGYEYRLLPMDSHSALRDRGGSSDGVQ